MSDSDQNQKIPQPPKGFFASVVPSIFSGALGGALEVLTFGHLLWTTKTRVQDKNIPLSQKITLNPSVLYRGVLPNLFSMAPITAIQVGISQALKSLFHGSDDKPPSDFQNLSYSAIGGATSALISGPTELGMAQQTAKRGFFATLRHIHDLYGVRGFATGLLGTAMRDAMFTVGFGFLAPIFKEKLKPYMEEKPASVIGGIGAGVPIGILSHPWDLVKSKQQIELKLTETEKAPVTPLWQMAKTTWQNEGLKGLYKGCTWRTGRVGMGLFIISETNEQIKKYTQSKNH